MLVFSQEVSKFNFGTLSLPNYKQTNSLLTIRKTYTRARSVHVQKQKSRKVITQVQMETTSHDCCQPLASNSIEEVGDLLLMCLRCEKSTSIHSDYSSSRRAVARDWQYLTYMYYYGLRLSSLWDKYSIY